MAQIINTPKPYIKVLVLASLLTACSTTTNKTNDVSYLQDGMIVISRSMPDPVSQVPETILGFMPANSRGTWIQIDSKLQQLKLMQGQTEALSFNIKLGKNITPGTFKLIHKQERPTWYATDDYFTNRGIAVPATSSRQRYLKGALGNQALFLGESLSIHSAPLWCEEVGGIRIEDKNLQEIYHRLELNSVIEIR